MRQLFDSKGVALYGKGGSLVRKPGDYPQKRWRQKYPDRALAESLQLYGVSLEWYRAKEAEQHGLCALCGQPETATRNGKVKRLSVDHDHIFGTTCALLCSACNAGLAWLEKSAWRVKAEAYLRQHGRRAQIAVVHPPEPAKAAPPAVEDITPPADPIPF